tara:strand:- start:634 stop:1479 length:846 start_codon:yes stop_codon:yes gene_type:complete
MDNNKFIWLTSYPKSGNTMIRLFLSTYFFTNDGKIDSFKNIKHITNFQNLILALDNVPTYKDFQKDFTKICPLWIKAQKINAKKIKKSLLVKTHSFMGKINNYPLTNKEYTKGFIHIVRDPRSVIISNMHHYNLSIEESFGNITDDKRFSLGTGAPVPEIISSWKNHYISWKKYSLDVPSITIKFEDIITDPKKNFLDILKFLQKIMSFKIDERKYNNSIEAVKFQNLKKLEQNIGFDEKLYGNSFFRKGLSNEWKDSLPKKIQNKIEEVFYKEMIELGYL